jgi:hypothetical protein
MKIHSFTHTFIIGLAFLLSLKVNAKVCSELRPCPPTANVHLTKSGIQKVLGIGIDTAMNSDQVNKLLNKKIQIPNKENEEIPKVCLEESKKSMSIEETKKFCFKICEDQEKLKSLSNAQVWSYCPISVPAMVLDKVEEGEYPDAFAPVPSRIRFLGFRLSDHKFGKAQLRYIDKSTILACVPVHKIKMISDLYIDDLKDGKSKAFVRDLKVEINKNGNSKSTRVCMKVRLGKDNKILEMVPYEKKTASIEDALRHSQITMLPYEVFPDKELIEYYRILNKELARMNQDVFPATDDPAEIRKYLDEYLNKYEEDYILNMEAGTLSIGHHLSDEEKLQVTAKTIKKLLQYLGKKYTFPNYDSVDKKKRSFIICLY